MQEITFDREIEEEINIDREKMFGRAELLAGDRCI